MEIRIQRKGFVYSFCFGYKTKWFSQLSFFTITKEYIGDRLNVEYAELIFRT